MTWAEGGRSLGAWCSLADPVAVQLFAGQGYDWVSVDRQHGTATDANTPALLQAIAAAGAAPVVRVRWNTPGEIMWALDMGAHAVIVPMVESAGEAARAAAACRFPPRGIRSYGPVRGAFGPHPAANDAAVACLVMVETAAALAVVGEIAAADGVDGIFVGPTDLAISLGVTPGTTPPVLVEAAERVVAACDQAGIVPGIYGGEPERARFWAARGFRMISICSDTARLGQAAAAALRTFGET
jgi:4-hydroxy-2-oxoheptanedioate aldolase